MQSHQALSPEPVPQADAFWAYIEAPETDEAFDHMARFFLRRLGMGGI